MRGGYTGKMLFVDLGTGKVETKPLNEDVARRFIGGYGLGARILYDLMKPGADPLGPDNVLGFVTGPLNGTGALFGGRYVVVCKSPVTGGINDANSGGYFGPELKKAGFDAVFISGAAPSPVYLLIKDGQAQIKDASNLWGKDSGETLDGLIAETGEKKLRAAVIGPAGEKLSLISCIMNDRHRAAGRGGAGAVMGSKKLKAVAVRGSGTIAVADEAGLKELNQIVAGAMKEGPAAESSKAFAKFGTGMGTGASALSGDSPVKNWGGIGEIDYGKESAHKLDAIKMDKYKIGKYACASCPLGCGADYTVAEGPWPLEKTWRPEYETSSAFGSLCLNDNAEAVIKCNDICNRYGLDTISTGATVAWAMECYENGLITKEDTGGIELTWGNADAMVAMTQAIADASGFGALLAAGSAGAAAKLGKGAEYLQTVKGIELPMHDPRLAPGYARTYQYDPTPGRHVKGGLGGRQTHDPSPDKYKTENSGPADAAGVTVWEVLQVSGICLFHLFVKPGMAPKMLSAVTGWEFDKETQKALMRRVMNIRHAFNLREGQVPADFVMPARAVGKPPQTAGPLAGITIDNEALAKNFFAAMEWDFESGKPSRQSLEAVGGLEDVIADLYG